MFAVAVIVIGSTFQYGYNTGVVNAPESIIEEFINETNKERHNSYISQAEVKTLYAVIVSAFTVGGMIGSFVAGYFANWLGRKNAVMCNNVIVVFAVMFFSSTKYAGVFELLIVGRFLIGINCGINSGLAPLYLTEIAPIKFRGALGTMNQMGIVTSILVSEILGLSFILGTAKLWPFLLVVPAGFALFQVILMPFCPDTPVFLLKSSEYFAARQSLTWLRSSTDVDNELQEIQRQIDSSLLEPNLGIKDLFKERHLLRPLIIAVVLQLAQQLSGINAIFYYSTQLFEDAGISDSNSAYATVGVGAVNTLATISAVVLVDKYGRRILLLVGLGGMFCASVLLTVTLSFKTITALSYVSLVAVFLFVIFFEVGPGSIPWFVTAELFKENARSSAIGIAGLVNWTGNLIIGLGYPPVENVLQGYTFVIFAVLLAIFWLFTYYKVPETKGRSIAEISNSFAS